MSDDGNVVQPKQDADGTPWVLSESDSRAVDTVVEAEFDGRRIAAPDRRTSQVLGLFGLLRVSPEDKQLNFDRSLLDATLARVGLARRRGLVSSAGGDRLSEADARALDALVEAGFAASTAGDARIDRVRSLVGLLDAGDAAPSESDLISRTLARVQAEADSRDAAMVIETRRGGRAPRIRLGDLISVAALILIGVSVLGPVAAGVRQQGRRLACENNLMQAGLGFGLYAGDYRESLPMASHSPAGNPWWYVGEQPERSNSANLFTLVRTNFVKAADLACVGNPHAPRSISAGQPAHDWSSLEEPSYSMQILFAAPEARPNWAGFGHRVVVLTDRSPIVPRIRSGQRFVNPFENSMNHAGAGQNVLFNDGSVEWMRSPVTDSGDNLWLPRQIEELIAQLRQPTEADNPIHGTESPAAATDAFVGP